MPNNIYVVAGFTKRSDFYGDITGGRNPPIISGRVLELSRHTTSVDYPNSTDTVIHYRGRPEKTFHIAGEMVGKDRVKPKRFNSGTMFEMRPEILGTNRLNPNDDMIMLEDGRFFVETDILTRMGEELVASIRREAPRLYKAFAAEAKIPRSARPL